MRFRIVAVASLFLAACGTKAGPGPDDGAGSGPVRLGDAENAQALAIDEQNIYWTEGESAGGWDNWHYRIHAMPKSGGASTTLAEGAGSLLNWPVANGGFVYWSMASCPQSCDMSDFRTFIHRVRRGGGAIATLKVETNLSELAVDDTRIYYRARFDSRNDDANGIWSVRLDGTDPRRLATHAKGSGPVLAGDTLYYLDTYDDVFNVLTTLNAVAVTGGTPRELRRETGTLMNPYRFPAFDGATVFISDPRGLWNLPADGSGWRRIWSGAAPSPGGRVDWRMPDASGGRVYFGQSPANGYPGCLGRVNPDGTGASCLDGGDHVFGWVKVDDVYAYYVRDQQIWRVAR